jgi:hypothetical protein
MPLPPLKTYPCGCVHNGYCYAPESKICDQCFAGKKLHFCEEYDELLIDKDSPEIETCLCFPRIVGSVLTEGGK